MGTCYMGLHHRNGQNHQSSAVTVYGWSIDSFARVRIWRYIAFCIRASEPDNSKQNLQQSYSLPVADRL